MQILGQFKVQINSQVLHGQLVTRDERKLG